MKHLTVRNVPKDLALSLDQTLIELLRHSLGVGKKQSNGLGRLAGTWGAEEQASFQEAIVPAEQVDEELWS